MDRSEPLLFLTYEQFPLLSRVREVIISVRSSAGPYNRRPIPDGPLVVLSLTNLGMNFCNNNRFHEAEEIFGHAVRIQECIDHPMHQDLLRPLIGLGLVFSRQGRFEKAEPTLLRALTIVGKTARIEEHRATLTLLVYVYQALNRSADADRMQSYLTRLLEENPFVVRDRHWMRKD
jgi:tetratricopeptide (TPR) repeat protein